MSKERKDVKLKMKSETLKRFCRSPAIPCLLRAAREANGCAWGLDSEGSLDATLLAFRLPSGALRFLGEIRCKYHLEPNVISYSLHLILTMIYSNEIFLDF